jgi:two-component system nitrogen regulation sensor histidine kinase GlnL
VIELPLKPILDNLTTAVVLLNNALHVAYLNPAGEILFGTSGRRVLQIAFTHLFRDDEDEVGEILQQALTSAQPYTKREARWHINGQALTIDYIATPINHSTQLLIEIHPLNRLIALAHESDMLTQHTISKNVVRGLAHEIKNPLGGIRGAAQLLSRELENSALTEYTAVIIQEADRLRNLVDRLMGPNTLPTFAACNIHEVLERIYHLIRAQYPHLLITRDYDPSLPDLIADKEQLIQAILNVVQNAAQIVGEQNDACIILRTRIERQWSLGNNRHRLACRIDIMDNGPGVEEHMLETIFYPLVSGRPQGTGLGLSIAQTLIKQHHGLIQCTSEPGNTVFSIFIPFEVTHDNTR